MRSLIFGGRGMLGRAVAEEAGRRGWPTLALSHAEADITDAAAVQARVRLILAMDLPPLVRIAQDHPDDAYRRALGAFTRDLWSRGGPTAGVPDEAAVLAAAARLW